MQIVSIPKETAAGERRVALVPSLVSKLTQAGFAVQIETGAGSDAGFSDDAYAAHGVQVVSQLSPATDVLLKVRTPTAAEIEKLKPESIVIGLFDPGMPEELIQTLCRKQITSFAMGLIPRIARAQAMDALSAMSTIAGYRAVLLAANLLPRFFPLLMTAAGTVPPARVLVIGAGVSGLEALGVARRLGAVVEACDVRPEVREEIESIGARFVAADALPEHVAAADVIITAAFVRGRDAPKLITEPMIGSMRPGSVIIDLAAEQGGNCTLTEPGCQIVCHEVTIVGPTNLPSSLPFHASEMYARTVLNFWLHLLKDGQPVIDLTDELIRSTLVTHRGEVRNRP
jgi:NAD(P) transhydrogenase subunit alpha